MFRSCARPRMNISAVAALTTMPMPATNITVLLSIGAVSTNRRTASITMAPVATKSRAALASDARIEALP
jgi:hypothetical protein